MVALGSASDDANKQYLKVWVQSWQRLQQEQLEGYMCRVQQSLSEQQDALQDGLRNLFEKQSEELQHFLEQPSSSDRMNLELQDVPIEEEGSTFNLQQTDVSDGCPENALGSKKKPEPSPKQLTQIQLRDMLSSFRGAAGWKRTPDFAILTQSSRHLVEADPFQGFFLRIVETPRFELLTAFVVIVNTVIIAIEADHAIQDSIKTGTYKSVTPRFVDWSFLVIFLLELLLRLMAKRCRFFIGSDRWWHAFDVSVVMVALAELLFATINLSFIRILRVFRMMRVFRIIRVFKILRSLRVMLSSILASFMTLAWAFVLLMLIMFLFNIVLIQGAAYYIKDHDVVPAYIQNGLEANFADFGQGMFTLLAMISGGKEWGEIADLFLQIHYVYFVIVSFYIVFVLFGVLNVVTAVFVESSANISSVDNDLVLQNEMDRTESCINQIELLFRELDEDKSGTLEWSEFQNNLSDPRVMAYLANLQIDVSEAASLFRLLDTDEDGSIAIEEFVLGCMRLKGMAKSIDIAMVMYEAKKQSLVNKYQVAELHRSLDRIATEVTRNTALIKRNMHQINDNRHKIDQSIEKVHLNKSHLELFGEDDTNHQEVNVGHGHGRKERSKPPDPSSITVVTVNDTGSIVSPSTFETWVV